MRNKPWMLPVSAALLLALALGGCSGPGAQQIDVHMVDDTLKYNTVSVSATGKIEVMPDIAYVTAGVVTQDADATKAQSDNSEIMNALFDALKTAGLTEDDIDTIGYSVNPMYNYDANTGKSDIYAYQVRNTVRIAIRDLKRVGEFIDIAGQSGANTDFSIQFTLEDKDAYYKDALTKAMEEARAKADTLAAAGKFTIKGVLTVSEGGYSYYPTYQYAVNEADYARETPVSPGELQVSASVTVVYSIE